MLKKMCSVALCLIMVTVAFIAMPFSASANGVIEIEADVRIEPETLNLASQGVFTAFIMLPAGYDVADIKLSAVKCEGVSAIRGTVARNTFIAKFNRQAVLGVLDGDGV